LTIAADELELVCTELNPALELLQGAGLRLEIIYPADDPHTAILSGAGRTVRLTAQAGAPPPPGTLPEFRPEFVLTRSGTGSGEGRAGMLYRDLVPGRLGGRYIASHITIPEGGPVADWVHFHRVTLQMIYVARGWVRVVYEDHGEAFVLHKGDLVLQPPEIRHRVLECSPGLEVIEISCPALHATHADHEMILPNSRTDPEREFGGQRFLHHVAAETPWTIFNGAEAQETALDMATRGLAQARTIRPGSSPDLRFPPHQGELVFGFVLDGSARLDFRGGFDLSPGDAFVIPPEDEWSLSAMSKDLRLLHFTTGKIHLAAGD
jgi:quercetin dioxygenase-like cupin family protein